MITSINEYEQAPNHEYYFTVSGNYSLNQVIEEIRVLADIEDIRSEHLSLHDLYLKAIKKANTDDQEQEL